VAFKQGADGLSLVLERGGIVSGRLLVDPWVQMNRLSVEVRSGSARKGSHDRTYARGQWSDGAAEAGIGEGFDVDDHGRFSVVGFAPPTVELKVKSIEDPCDAVSIPDVAVRRPGEPPDARLDPLDLRGKFELLSVDVHDESGRGWSGAHVTLRDPARLAESRSRSTLPGGHAEFLTRAGPHDIEVESEGYRSVHLESVYGDQVVVLRGGIPVLVRVRGSSARPPPPDLLAVGFLAGSGRWLEGIGTLNDPLQTRFLVGSPGIHQVGWFFQHGNVQAYLGPGVPPTVDVRDRDDVQEFVLDLPADVEAAWTHRLKDFERDLADQKERESSRDTFPVRRR
jgi:hypothetical protein